MSAPQIHAKMVQPVAIMSTPSDAIVQLASGARSVNVTHNKVVCLIMLAGSMSNHRRQSLSAQITLGPSAQIHMPVGQSLAMVNVILNATLKTASTMETTARTTIIHQYNRHLKLVTKKTHTV